MRLALYLAFGILLSGPSAFAHEFKKELKDAPPKIWNCACSMPTGNV